VFDFISRSFSGFAYRRDYRLASGRSEDPLQNASVAPIAEHLRFFTTAAMARLQGGLLLNAGVECGRRAPRRTNLSLRPVNRIIGKPLLSIRMSSQRLYRVTFQNQGQLYEIYARNVSHGAMMGFVEIEKLVFGEKTTLLVDPSEEKLKTEFANVVRTYIPLHAVVRIDEVAKPGPARIKPASGEPSNVMPFPLYSPNAPGGGQHKK